MEHSHKNPSSSKGQGLVEFALIAMLLILLAFGVMDMARVFQTTIVVMNASREGARHGASYPEQGRNGAITAARAEAGNAGIDMTKATINATCNEHTVNLTCLAGPVSVTVAYEFSTFLGNLFSASPFTISRTTEMLVPGFE